MERTKVEQTKERLPQSVEEAVRIFLDEGNKDDAIKYLKSHRDDVTEFCMQTFEAYRAGDKSGIIMLGMIIEKLL